MTRNTPSRWAAILGSLLRGINSSAVVTVAAVLALGAASTIHGAGEPTSPWRSWSLLRFKAKAMPLFSGRVEMHLSSKAGKVRFRTRSTARFMGARIASSETTTTLEASTGRIEQYVSRNRKRARRYLFGESGYTVEKLEPVEGPDAPLDAWEVTSKHAFDYPTGDDGSVLPVFDYYGMLLQLGRESLEQPGDEVTLQVATTRGPTPYRIRVAEARTADWTYKDPELGARRTVPLRELRLRISPADPDRADEGFLSMEGESELWVEAGSKTLLSLGGKVPKVPGRVRLVLIEMQ